MMKNTPTKPDLTREFKQTVVDRIERDPGFAKALSAEADAADPALRDALDGLKLQAGHGTA